MDNSSQPKVHVTSLPTTKMVTPVTMTAITNKTAEASVINCIFQADILICNGTEFTLRLTPLTYLDHIFWMYLIMYIVLTIFAGIVIFSVDYNDGTNEPGTYDSFLV